VKSRKQDSKAPKVIVWTQAYNAEKTLRRAIESVIGQTHGDFEYLLLDRESLDQTGSIIREYAKRDTRLMTMDDIPQIGVRDIITIVQERHPDNFYLCWLDADDEYEPDFLEKTLTFAREHDLDIAVSGSNYIEAGTGRIVQKKTIAENLIVEGRGFADDFLLYRPYVNAFWNKLFRHTVFKKTNYTRPPILTKFADDSVTVLDYLKCSKRVGFLAQTLHKYYLYPQSFSTVFHLDRLNDCHLFFRHYKDFLRRFGPISPLNMDYLYAIWLGWMEEHIFNHLQSIDAPLETKLNCIAEIFKSRVTKAMLRREADERFRNLASRDEFLQRVRDWVYSQKEAVGWEQHKKLAAQIIRSMNV